MAVLSLLSSPAGRGTRTRSTAARRRRLLVRAFEQLPAAEGLGLARVTYEFMRPVPVGPLEVRAEVVRPGRRVQLLEASIVVDGVEVVRARALQVKAADAGGAAARKHPTAPGARARADHQICRSLTTRCSPSTPSRSCS